MQSEILNNESPLYELYKASDILPESQVISRNKFRKWRYGYDKEHDVIIISKTGAIGDIYVVNGLRIALPLYDSREECLQRHSKKEEQYWERAEIPEPLSKIQSIFHWNEKPDSFKSLYIDYIENEFSRRDKGVFFMNNGEATYITGSHYFYIQWSKIDVGYPDFREANRIFWIYWEACKADSRSFGMDYLKIRRSGYSYMGGTESVNIGTLAKDSRIGILSKTGSDAKKLFTDKVVNINSFLPFFFKPVMAGMDKPKTELSYKVPASKITKKNMIESESDSISGLNTTIDWKSTDDNSYDGEKLLYLLHDESGKWLKPSNILNNWRVVKTCLRLGSKIVGKCMMGSTSNALDKGGDNFKKLFFDSDPSIRSKNGQTKSGLYSLFIPMEWNMEGFIDRYGMPVLRTPEEPVLGVDGEMIEEGAIDYWEAEVEALKNDPDALNEYYRQFPRTLSHAFRDESKSSLFNLTKIYSQVDYNDTMVTKQHITRGSFHWKDGIKDTEVVWTPNSNGRFLVSWIPKANLQNRVIKKRGLFYPGNEHIGAFGCDSYDISGTVGGKGSNGALSGLTKYHMDEAPTNEFFLEYIARPQTAEIFFEDVLMACVFYGMPILAENNKPRLLYHFKHRGYRGFSINRPDKVKSRLSVTEKELGGIPNSSEDIRQAHASAIESYIERYVGYDVEGKYRPSDEMGVMPFNRTLNDWARFDINKRTKYDASISSGLAIMACQKHLYQPISRKKESKIKLNFARYRNEGNHSALYDE